MAQPNSAAGQAPTGSTQVTASQDPPKASAAAPSMAGSKPLDEVTGTGTEFAQELLRFDLQKTGKSAQDEPYVQFELYVAELRAFYSVQHASNPTDVLCLRIDGLSQKVASMLYGANLISVDSKDVADGANSSQPTVLKLARTDITCVAKSLNAITVFLQAYGKKLVLLPKRELKCCCGSVADNFSKSLIGWAFGKEHVRCYDPRWTELSLEWLYQQANLISKRATRQYDSHKLYFFASIPEGRVKSIEKDIKYDYKRMLALIAHMLLENAKKGTRDESLVQRFRTACTDYAQYHQESEDIIWDDPSVSTEQANLSSGLSENAQSNDKPAKACKDKYKSSTKLHGNESEYSIEYCQVDQKEFRVYFALLNKYYTVKNVVLDNQHRKIEITYLDKQETKYNVYFDTLQYIKVMPVPGGASIAFHYRKDGDPGYVQFRFKELAHFGSLLTKWVKKCAIQVNSDQTCNAQELCKRLAPSPWENLYQLCDLVFKDTKFEPEKDRESFDYPCYLWFGQESANETTATVIKEDARRLVIQLVNKLAIRLAGCNGEPKQLDSMQFLYTYFVTVAIPLWFEFGKPPYEYAEASGNLSINDRWLYGLIDAPEW